MLGGRFGGQRAVAHGPAARAAATGHRPRRSTGGMLALADVARWAKATPGMGVEAALAETLGEISKRSPEAPRVAAE